MPLESDVEAVRKAMSATPRTDALYYPFGRGHTTCRNVSVQEGLALAEWLERELAAANQRAEQRFRDGMLEAARICVLVEKRLLSGGSHLASYGADRCVAEITAAAEQNAAPQVIEKANRVSESVECSPGCKADWRESADTGGSCSNSPEHGKASAPDSSVPAVAATEQNAAGQDQAALKGQVPAAPREFTGREIREHGLDSDRFVSAWEYRALALRVGGQNIKK